MEPVKGKVVFEHVDPSDLPDVVRSVRGSGRSDVLLSAPGVGVDELMAWALREVELARNSREASDERRYATDSLLNGRRALACLVDWYLERDCFSLCARAPKRAEDKSHLLQERRIFDATAARALQTAIMERDKVEHQFAAATLQQAESFVETMRSTISRLRAESNPSLRPFLFGRMSYRLTVGTNGGSAQFFGWLEPCFIFCSLDKRPWLGAAIPDQSDPASAKVRRTFFDETPTQLLLKVVQALEDSFGPSQGSLSTDLAKRLLQEAGAVSRA